METKQKILDQCRKSGLQITPLREQVLDIVLEFDGVIKAYTVLAQMQRSSASVVAPPTAYRALDFWAEHGVLHKIPAVNGYVLCTHAVDEQSLTAEWAALRSAVAAGGFNLNEEHVVLTGICAKCH